jgi:hypothetical protein
MRSVAEIAVNIAMLLVGLSGPSKGVIPMVNTFKLPCVVMQGRMETRRCVNRA